MQKPLPRSAQIRRTTWEAQIDLPVQAIGPSSGASSLTKRPVSWEYNRKSKIVSQITSAKKMATICANHTHKMGSWNWPTCTSHWSNLRCLTKRLVSWEYNCKLQVLTGGKVKMPKGGGEVSQQLRTNNNEKKNIRNTCQKLHSRILMRSVSIVPQHQH